MHNRLYEKKLKSLVANWIIDSNELQIKWTNSYRWRWKRNPDIPVSPAAHISKEAMRMEQLHRSFRVKHGLQSNQEIYQPKLSDKNIIRNNRKKINTEKYQLDRASEYYKVSPATYLTELLDLSKKRWHTAERYNIIMYAFMLPTTYKMYPWIKDLMAKHNMLVWRSIYMTSDHCVPTSSYINKDQADNLRMVCYTDPINRHINTRENAAIKRRAKKSNESYKLQECIETNRIIHAPDYSLITFAAELIEIHNNQASDKSIQAMMETTHEANTAEEYHPIMNSSPPKHASLEELIAYEERKAWIN